MANDIGISNKIDGQFMGILNSFQHIPLNLQSSGSQPFLGGGT